MLDFYDISELDTGKEIILDKEGEEIQVDYEQEFDNLDYINFISGGIENE